MTQKMTQRELLRTQRERESRKRITGLVVGALALVAAILLVYFLPRLLNTSKVEGYASQAGQSVGDPNAPVKVVEFSNFGCSHCRTFALENEEQFVKEYVETGKVYFTYKVFQFSEDETFKAAEAAYCAGDQDRFFEMQKLLFQNSAFAGAYADSSISSYAKQLGLNMTEFNQCMENDTQLANIRADTANAQALGVTGTPMFDVNGTIVYSTTLNESVEAALAAAGN
ncbi:MAG TPA: DsbA family protein [Anaerolineaceae bacterium]|nr:DsbA family protein [Anaerolineaceae bacterium]